VGPGDVFALHRVISDYREGLICIAPRPDVLRLLELPPNKI
jgi:hypothetical protein